MAGIDFTPVGSQDNPFNGKFDGDGYTISNLTISKPLDNNVGVFSYLGAGSSAANITLKDCSIAGNECVGAIVGFNNGIMVTNCVVSGNSVVSGVAGLVGGIAGTNATEALVTKCTVGGDTEVVGKADNVGGIAGDNYGTISDCKFTGMSVSTIETTCGGIAGLNKEGAYITGCVVTKGSISGLATVGGITGSNVGYVIGWY